jgi:hypothetical protein
MKPITWKRSKVNTKIIYLYVCAVSNPDYTVSNSWMTIMNWKGWWMRDRAQILRYYLGIRLEELRKTTGNISQESRCPGRDSNQVPPEHKSDALPLEPTCTAKTYIYQIETYLIKWTMPNIIISLVWLRHSGNRILSAPRFVNERG